VAFLYKTFEDGGFGRRYAWIDFVNSEEYDGFGLRVDHLVDSTWVKAFSRRWLLGKSLAVKSRFRDLTRTRELLRSIAQEIAAGEGLSPRDLRTMNKALRTPMYQSLKKTQQRCYVLEIVPPRYSWSWVRAELFRSLATMVAEGQQHRLKICPNSGCRWVFFDQTHANTRKWCSDLTCGNRDKVRRHRARRVARQES
jgi:predicted RNA-binding Zn ribbon-like protein